MLKQITYRILPTAEQQVTLSCYFGCVRYVYNKTLEIRLQNNEKRYKELTKDILQMKTDNLWLMKCPSQCLQIAIGDLCNDHNNFNQGKSYPVFRKKNRQQSIVFPQGVKIRFKTNTIKIPKLGIIEAVYDRQFIGKIKTVTLYKTATGKYFINILIDNQKKESQKIPVAENTTIGISKGINTWYALSNGTRISKPLRIQKAERNLKVQQRSLIRKQRQSKRRSKQVMTVLLSAERLRNMKRDYLQKVSTKMIIEYDTIVMENVSDELKTLLEYKCRWYGKTLIEIGKCIPCPIICSSCGNVTQSEGITWVCKKCETVHNRNNNNAQNVKILGLGIKPSIANVPKVPG